MVAKWSKTLVQSCPVHNRPRLESCFGHISMMVKTNCKNLSDYGPALSYSEMTPANQGSTPTHQITLPQLITLTKHVPSQSRFSYTMEAPSPLVMLNTLQSISKLKTKSCKSPASWLSFWIEKIRIILLMPILDMPNSMLF